MPHNVRRNNSTPPEGNLSLSTGFISRDPSPTKSKLDTRRRTYLDNRGTSEQKNNKAQRKSFSERLATRHKTKHKLIKLLDTLGEKSLSDRLRLCGASFAAITCGKHIVQRIPNHICDFRLCPHCAPRRSRKILKKYVPRAESFVQTGGIKVTPVHLVLTQGKREGERLQDARKRILDSFRRLKKRGFWREHFAGGMYAVEVTNGSDGRNHVHLHLLAFRWRFFDVAALRAEWGKATNGEGLNLFLRRVEDLKSGMREVVKYISKPLDIDKFRASHIKEFLEMKGAKMFGVFGEFAEFCKTYEEPESDNQNESESGGFSEGDCCPFCDEPLFEVQLTASELIGFARRLETVPRFKPDSC